MTSATSSRLTPLSLLFYTLPSFTSTFRRSARSEALTIAKYPCAPQDLVQFPCFYFSLTCGVKRLSPVDSFSLISISVDLTKLRSRATSFNRREALPSNGKCRPVVACDGANDRVRLELHGSFFSFSRKIYAQSIVERHRLDASRKCLVCWRETEDAHAVRTDAKLLFPS